MPAVGMDDGGWGQIAAGLADALSPDPYKKARMMMAGASYRKTELETERERQQQAAIRRSIEAFPGTLPPVSLPPTADGQEQAGPMSPQQQAQQEALRRLRIADNEAATWHVKSASDYAQGVHANRGMGAIAGGIPSSQAQQDVIQTQISPIGGSLPNYSSTPHTYQPMDANNQPVGGVVTSRRMPEGPAALMGPGKLGEVNNPFENDPKMVQALAGFAQRINRGGTLEAGEIENAGIMLDRLHPVTTETQTVNGRLTPVNIRKGAVEAGFGRIANLVDDYREKFAPGATGDRRTLSPPVSMPGVSMPGVGAGGTLIPGAPVGGLAGMPAAAGAPAPAEPIVPVVPPVGPAASAGVTRLGAGGPQVQIGAPISSTDPHQLGQTAKSDKLTYEYETVQQNWESMVENLKVDSKAADIGLIFAAAKVLDPPSVVRGQEGEELRKTGGWGDQALGLLNQVTGGTKLTAAQRADLAHMVQNRAQATEKVYFEQRARWEEQGRQGGLTPTQIKAQLPTAAPLTRFNIDDVNKYLGVQQAGGIAEWKRSSAAPRIVASPPATTAPPAGDYRDLDRLYRSP